MAMLLFPTIMRGEKKEYSSREAIVRRYKGDIKEERTAHCGKQHFLITPSHKVSFLNIICIFHFYTFKYVHLIHLPMCVFASLFFF